MGSANGRKGEREEREEREREKRKRTEGDGAIVESGFEYIESTILIPNAEFHSNQL
jgi:hypothetical protein